MGQPTLEQWLESRGVSAIGKRWSRTGSRIIELRLAEVLEREIPPALQGVSMSSMDRGTDGPQRYCLFIRCRLQLSHLTPWSLLFGLATDAGFDSRGDTNSLGRNEGLAASAPCVDETNQRRRYPEHLQYYIPVTTRFFYI